MASDFAVLAGALLIGLSAADSASARGGARGGGFHHGGFHHGARVGVFIGAPVFAWGYGYGPYYYPPYYYPPAYYPPAVAAPQTYVERADEQVAPAVPSDASSWYYCPDSKAYYPYVKSCPGPWQRVAPQPPNS